MMMSNLIFLKKNKGFTLIELVMVIIIMGILAVTVLPKFFGSNGFEEYAYRTEVISTLRAVQQKAMQDTANCYQIVVTAKVIQENTNGCQIPPATSNTEILVSVIIDADHDVSFNNNLYFSFTDLGQPVNANIEESDVIITISGEKTLEVMINSEGYIYAL